MPGEEATFIVAGLLTDEEMGVLREILEFLVPRSVHISMSDAKDYLVHGYKKEKIIERMLESAEKEPLVTSLRLRTIYCWLKRCYEPNPVEEL